MKRYLPDGRKVKVNRSQRRSMERGFASCSGVSKHRVLTDAGDIMRESFKRGLSFLAATQIAKGVQKVLNFGKRAS